VEVPASGHRAAGRSIEFRESDALAGRDVNRIESHGSVDWASCLGGNAADGDPTLPRRGDDAAAQRRLAGARGPNQNQERGHFEIVSLLAGEMSNVYPDRMSWEDLIVVTPGVRGGKPCIAGTRITVQDVLEYLASGMTEAALLEDFPSLTSDSVRAVLAFAAARERRLATPAA
jgi:uncharacterized protein (DUF433 family)